MAVFYFSCADKDTLTSMLVGMQGNRPVMLYTNVIGPLPATDTAGVAGQYYMSIDVPELQTFPTALPTGVIEDDVNGTAVLGVWA